MSYGSHAYATKSYGSVSSWSGISKAVGKGATILLTTAKKIIQMTTNRNTTLLTNKNKIII